MNEAMFACLATLYDVRYLGSQHLKLATNIYTPYIHIQQIYISIEHTTATLLRSTATTSKECTMLGTERIH